MKTTRFLVKAAYVSTCGSLVAAPALVRAYASSSGSVATFNDGTKCQELTSEVNNSEPGYENYIYEGLSNDTQLAQCDTSWQLPTGYIGTYFQNLKQTGPGYYDYAVCTAMTGWDYNVGTTDHHSSFASPAKACKAGNYNTLGQGKFLYNGNWKQSPIYSGYQNIP